RTEEARRFLERALEIDERTYGPEHPKVATDLANLASVLKATGQAQVAVRLLVRSLVITRNVHGPEHPKVATRLASLGTLLCDAGRTAEARTLFARALAIDERAFGPEHPTVVHDRRNLASVEAGAPGAPGTLESAERVIAGIGSSA